jgi:hypothetical protein
MSRWFASKKKIHKCIEEQEKYFMEDQNKKPNLGVEDWMGKYIFTDIHKILFGGSHKELYEWLSRLADTQFEIRSRPPMVWMSTLINKAKRVDNIMLRAVDD